MNNPSLIMRQFFRLESRLFLALLTFSSLSFAGARTSVAGKVKFPSDNPAFTVEFPPGWTYARDKDGNLNGDPRDDSGYAFSILRSGGGSQRKGTQGGVA